MEARPLIAILIASILIGSLLAYGVLHTNLPVPNIGKTSGEGSPLISVNPTSLNWGNGEIGIGETAYRTITITNTQTFPVSVFDFDIGINPSPSDIANDLDWNITNPVTLSAGESVVAEFALTIPNNPDYAGVAFSFDVIIHATAPP